MDDTSDATARTIDSNRLRRGVVYALMALVAFSLVAIVPAAAQETTTTTGLNGDNQSFICNVAIFKNSMNAIIQFVVAIFSPVAIAGLLGDRLADALPIGKKRKKKFKEWRGSILISSAGIYLGLPLGVEFAKQAGIPLASCVNYVPW